MKLVKFWDEPLLAHSLEMRQPDQMHTTTPLDYGYLYREHEVYVFQHNSNRVDWVVKIRYKGHLAQQFTCLSFMDGLQQADSWIDADIKKAIDYAHENNWNVNKG